jgi:23S rRNA (uridine2552-2'-O)-methyltransferase
MTRWYQEKKKEHFYKRAKKEGYRARSAYKLLQIQKKFHIIKSGDIVVDLGAAPGGWSQVAHNLVQPNGLLVGVDLSFIKPYKDIIFIQGDMTQNETLHRILEAVDFEPVSVVLSDMAPDISGNYSMDHAKSIYLAEQALKTARHILCKNGSFVCKIFMGDMVQEFVLDIKEYFKRVKQFTPQASRKSSSEQYIIAQSFNI